MIAPFSLVLVLIPTPQAPIGRPDVVARTGLSHLLTSQANRTA